MVKNWLDDLKISQQKSLDDVYTAVYEEIQKFIRSNRDLHNISSDNRSIIIRNATDSITCLGGPFAYSQSISLTDEYFWKNFVQKYGEIGKNLTYNAIKFVDRDVILMKMGLCLMACSQHHSIFTLNMSYDHLDTLMMFKIQNIYAELIWKYLLYKYGYEESIMKYFNLIQCLMSVIIAMSYAQNIQAHVNDIEIIAENIELSLIIDDIEKINETIS